MLTLPFRCPRCKRGAISDTAAPCPACGEPLPSTRGVLDFVSDAARKDEQAYYDEEYAGVSTDAALPLEALDPHWEAPGNILRGLVRRHVGDLHGKRALLLGNGSSDRELYFLRNRPAALVFSDLSPQAVRAIQVRYADVLAGQPVAFAAIDAYDLPFQDGALDLVYGFAFVHHLPELDGFFAEVARVLAPGGRAVFMDDAYAPLWQRSKVTWLRPLMAYTHRRQPISPEDMRCTLAGGFREEDLAPRIRAVGGQPFFERQSFLNYFWTRAADRLFPERWLPLRDQRHIQGALIWLDEQLSRFSTVRNNLIRLVWGFTIPGTREE